MPAGAIWAIAGSLAALARPQLHRSKDRTLKRGNPNAAPWPC